MNFMLEQNWLGLLKASQMVKWKNKRYSSGRTTSINCLSFLRELLYSGNGRQILQDVLSDEDLEACKCAGHSCGMVFDKWSAENYEADCTDGGDPIHGNESPRLQEEQPGLLDAISETDEIHSRKRLWDGSKISRKNGQVLYGRKNDNNGNVNRKIALLINM